MSLSPTVRMLTYGVCGFGAMIASLHFAFKQEWSPGTFFLVASLIADFHFYKAYDDSQKK